MTGHFKDSSTTMLLKRFFKSVCIQDGMSKKSSVFLFENNLLGRLHNCLGDVSITIGINVGTILNFKDWSSINGSALRSPAIGHCPGSYPDCDKII